MHVATHNSNTAAHTTTTTNTNTTKHNINQHSSQTKRNKGVPRVSCQRARTTTDDYNNCDVYYAMIWMLLIVLSFLDWFRSMLITRMHIIHIHVCITPIKEYRVYVVNALVQKLGDRDR